MQKILLVIFLYLGSGVWAKSGAAMMQLLPEGEVHLSIMDQTWDYFESTELFNHKLPIVEHKTFRELRGFIQTEFTVLRPHRNFDYTSTSKEICDDLHQYYQSVGVANGFSKMSVELITGTRHPICHVFYLNHQAYTEQFVFLGRLKGRAPASLVYLTHTLTMTYPEVLRQKAELEIAKVLSSITRVGP